MVSLSPLRGQILSNTEYHFTPDCTLCAAGYGCELGKSVDEHAIPSFFNLQDVILLYPTGSEAVKVDVIPTVKINTSYSIKLFKLK